MHKTGFSSPQQDPLETLIKTLARLQGLGPRSARRIALQLFKKREQLLLPLAQQLMTAHEHIQSCQICGNLSLHDPCLICQDHHRDRQLICVVQDVDDLWAMERTGSYAGLYHVLGGTLSALDGVRPEDLRIAPLLNRLSNDEHTVREIILALSATVDGQATAYYIADQCQHIPDLKITRLAQGIPIGGELDYLDEGTLTLALQSRSAL